MQADGYFHNFFDKHKNRIIPRIKFCVAESSNEMLKKIKQILKTEFNKDVTIFAYRNSLRLETSVAKLIPSFNELKLDFKDPPKPPEFVLNDKELFGAYLAGVVDGDGNICIKRPKYPQCRIKITSGTPQYRLAETIKRFFNCYVGLRKYKTVGYLNGRLIKGKGCDLEFYVSSKNMKKLPMSLLDYLCMPKKHAILSTFLKQNSF